jgi:hypothetical protein
LRGVESADVQLPATLVRVAEKTDGRSPLAQLEARGAGGSSRSVTREKLEAVVVSGDEKYRIVR